MTEKSEISGKAVEAEVASEKKKRSKFEQFTGTFSDIFISRPRLAAVVNIVIALAGVFGLLNMPVEEYPNITPPTLYVKATYTGASADVVEETVGMPIEDEVNGVEDLLYFSSTSSNDGTYGLSVTFQSGTDTDIALVNLQNAVKRAEANLPGEVTKTGITVEKRGNDNLGMVAFLTDGSSMDLSELAEWVNGSMKDALSRVEGVSSADLLSNRERAMRIWLDNERLAGVGLSAADVVTAIENSNLSAAAGSMGTEGANSYISFKLNVAGRLPDAKAFSEIVLKTDSENGRRILLGDVARIELGSKSYSGTVMHNGQESVGLGLYRSPEANALATMNRVKEELKAWEPRFPKGVSYVFGYDPTVFITVSMEEMVTTLVLALVLVIAVTWIFLGDWRATVVPALAIPISLLGAFGVLKVLGMSLNTFTMFGLILVIGSLVDDAIVVAENTQRIINEEGVSAPVAASRSMKQITTAVIATTLVTMACYAPLIFYDGMVGAIYEQFAASMCIALAFSTVVALTLSPALCALALRPTHTYGTNPDAKDRPRGLLARASVGIEALRSLYVKCVSFLLDHLVACVVAFACVIAGSYVLYKQLPNAFIPEEDKGVLMVNIELAPGAAQARTQNAMTQVRNFIMDIPGVKGTMTMSGRSMMSGSGENAAMCIADLQHWSDRTTEETSQSAIQQKILVQGQSIAAAKVIPFAQPAIMGLGSVGGVTFELCSEEGAKPDELADVARNFLNELQQSPAVMTAMTSFKTDNVQLRLNLDRDKASLLGVHPSDVFTALQNSLASYYVNDFTFGNANREVIVQGDVNARASVEGIETIMVPNDQGENVPLSTISNITKETGAQELMRFNKMRSAEVNAQAAQGFSSGDVFAAVEAIKLPQGYHVEWTGLALQEKGNQGRIVWMAALAILFAYLFLVGQYESWALPGPVMLTVFFAIFGGLLGLVIAGQDMNVYAQLGLVMLVGLAAKSAVLMVEFSKAEYESGKSIREAALSGASMRFRAVMMTAWSFVVGVIPMVFATGAGSGARRAIGVTTFSGMLIASSVGILFTPVFFALIEHSSKFFTKRGNSESSK